MPELPEVEVVTAQLRRLLRGRTIISAHVRRPKLIGEISPQVFETRLRGRTVQGVSQRGKIILIALDGGLTWATHLRMSGTFRVLRDGKELPRFTHAIFALDDRRRLIFEDVRHFGWMTVMRSEELMKIKSIAKLGPEPLADTLSTEYFCEAASRCRRSVKEFIVDQTVIAGLGNIYASEALCVAGISPRRRANRISKARIEKLRTAIVNVIARVRRRLSVQPQGPGRTDGKGGGGSRKLAGQARKQYYFDVSPAEFLVYDREGEPCYACGTPIKRIVQGQRSTYYCPVCQE